MFLSSKIPRSPVWKYRKHMHPRSCRCKYAISIRTSWTICSSHSYKTAHVTSTFWADHPFQSQPSGDCPSLGVNESVISWCSGSHFLLHAFTPVSHATCKGHMVPNGMGTIELLIEAPLYIRLECMDTCGLYNAGDVTKAYQRHWVVKGVLHRCGTMHLQYGQVLLSSDHKTSV